jgi:hypothetical protein
VVPIEPAQINLANLLAGRTEERQPRMTCSDLGADPKVEPQLAVLRAPAIPDRDNTPSGQDLFRMAGKMGLEGIVSKGLARAFGTGSLAQSEEPGAPGLQQGQGTVKRPRRRNAYDKQQTSNPRCVVSGRRFILRVVG